MGTDHVFIKRMELLCRIGTTIEERAFPQVIIVSVRMYLALKSAGKTDSIENTIDYAETIKKIRNLAQLKTYALAEAIAEDIASLSLEAAICAAVEVEINKKVFQGIDAVGVFIRREK